MVTEFANEYDIREFIRDLLDETISDPIQQRSLDGKNWIYTDFPRKDSTYPRIAVVLTDKSYDNLSLGSAEQLKTVNIQISVIVDASSNKFDIDGDGNTEHEEEVLGVLTQKVEDALINNQSQFRDRCARYALPVNTTRTRDNDANTIQQNITVEVPHQ